VKRVRYLTVDDIIKINESFIGPYQLRDFGLLESAVFRPQQSFLGADPYPDGHEKAAALAHSLIRNHPFVDANKRTAMAAMNIFYNFNGWRLQADDDDVVALALDIAGGLLDVTAIVGRLKDWAVEIEVDE
jgi:death-on-curing protein